MEDRIFRSLTDGDADDLFVDIEVKPYHLQEIAAVHPEMKALLDNGMFTSTVFITPARYFHTTRIQVHFYSPIAERVSRSVNDALFGYSRAILAFIHPPAKPILKEKDVFRSCFYAGIEDADFAYPIAFAVPVTRYQMDIYGKTPQRGIVSPSTRDLVALKLGSDLKEAFDETDSVHKYRGHTSMHMKNAIQDNLSDLSKAKSRYLRRQKRSK